MKTKLHTIAFAILTTSAVIAQDTITKSETINGDGSTETTVKTTTSTGTITEYVPGTTFNVKETDGPVTYRYGKTVSYVTKSGKVIAEDEVKTRIRVGLPVSVHYVLDGENRVISRIVIDDTTVKGGGKTETTVKTTTSTGTISEFVPGTTFTVKETDGPVTYRYGKTVIYVTKSGKVITKDEVKSLIKVGIPVRVHYVLDGENRVISRVVIDDTSDKGNGTTETTVRTTTSTGTITGYVPGTTFIVKETDGPVTYRYGKTVAYVTRSGKVIAKDEVKSHIKVGLPVSVDYVTDGENRVISRVVIDD